MLLRVDLSDLSSFADIHVPAGWNCQFDGSRKIIYSDLDCNNDIENKTKIDIVGTEVVISRSSSAEIPLFFCVTKTLLFLSDSIYELQKKMKKNVDMNVAYEYIYSQFLPKDRTLFEDVFQLLNSQKISFSFKNGKIISLMEDGFSLPMTEMDESDESVLALRLREEIIQAHKVRLGSSNALFLSGGLDSQAMAVTLSKDLELGGSVEGIHFYVKNSAQIELDDARKTAVNLGIGFTAVEVDPNEGINFDSLLEMNAPYLGVTSIEKLLSVASLEQGVTVFTGQDTRLHTPSLKKIDERLLSLYSFPFVGKSLSQAATLLLNTRKLIIKSYDSKVYRNLSFFACSDDVQHYLVNRFFHITNLPFQDKNQQLKLLASISDDLGKLGVSNKRAMFNTLVKELWRRQFLYDINYMQGAAQGHGLKLAAPFYDARLADFSARLPFGLASKITKGRSGHGNENVSVNKYLLRKAYHGELDDSLIYRDKAVCLTGHLFFNGGMRGILSEFINDKTIVRDDSYNVLYLGEIQKLCKVKHGIWQEQDHWLMMMVFNALVVYRFLKESN